MIKINFKNTKVSNLQNQESNPANIWQDLVTFVKDLTNDGVEKEINESEISLPSDAIIRVVINVILILSIPLSLKIYETYVLNQLEIQKNQQNVILKQKEQKLTELSDFLTKNADVAKKAKQYNTKKEFLKKKATDRIIIVQTLSTIESNISENIWLKSVNIDLKKDHSKISLSGNGANETHINKFSNRLAKFWNSDSITVNTTDVKKGNSTIKVSFKLEGIIQ